MVEVVLSVCAIDLVIRTTLVNNRWQIDTKWRVINGR